MSGERICGLNHDRKEFLTVGHSSWGEVDLSDIPKALMIFGPCVQKGIDQYNHHNEQFGIQELVPWSKAVELGYDRRKGFWDK